VESEEKCGKREVQSDSGYRKFQIPPRGPEASGAAIFQYFESTFILPLLIAFPKGFVFSGCFIAIDPAFIPKEKNNRDSDKRYVHRKF